MINGLLSIQTPWNAGMITGTPSHRFSSSHRRSERSFIPQMQLNPWIRLTGNWIAREAFFRTIQHFWKPCIWQLLRQQRNGQPPSGTGHRSMENCVLCTKVDFLNKIPIPKTQAGILACSWHVQHVLLYIKQGQKAQFLEPSAHHYHRRSEFTDFFS